MAEYFDYNSSYSSSLAESKPEPPKKSSALTVKKEAPPKSKKPLKRRNPTRQPEEVRASTAEISETADSVEIREEQGGVKPLRKRGPAPPDGGLKRFRALLVTLDAFVGYDSKKKLMNVIAGSPEELADVIESRLMSEYEIEIPSVNFGIQYFDNDFEQLVDLDDLQFLPEVAKVVLVPKEGVGSASTPATSRLMENGAVPTAQPAELGEASLIRKDTKGGAAETKGRVTPQSIKQKPKRWGKTDSPEKGGDFDYERFKNDLIQGIPFVKRSAKDAKPHSRVLYADRGVQFINWRAPWKSSEKDHFDMFRARPIWSKKKEPIPLASLRDVRAAKSPRGLHFIRLSFDSRNLDIEAADEETFQEMALGFKMVMRVMGNGGGALASSPSGVESDDDAASNGGGSEDSYDDDRYNGADR